MGNSFFCEKTDEEPEVSHVGMARRRLSVGNLEGVATGSEEDRGLVQQLKGKDVLETLTDSIPLCAMRSKGNVGSTPDNRTGRRNSFTEKGIEAKGDVMDPAQWGIGYSCMKGLKPESPNQDSWSVLRVDETFAIYGVYDGHGIHGHTISNFVKEQMPKLLLRDPRFRTEDADLLKESFETIQRLIVSTYKDEAQFSGTTATVVIHDLAARTLTIAHAGDCTVVLGAQEGTKSFGTVLTRDHKPDLADEKERIQKAGGRVVWDGFFNYRVAARNSDRPGLNMSRCLGDLYGHDNAGLSCVPEVRVHNISASDSLLFVCSDGVWEFIKAQEAVDLVALLAPGDMKGACQKLAKEAWDRWIAEEGDVVDDITAVIVNLQM